MAKYGISVSLSLIILGASTWSSPAQQPGGPAGDSSASTFKTAGAAVPVSEERRVVKGPDGQWYFVSEDPAPATKLPEDQAANPDNKPSTWASLSDEISKALTVTLKDGGKLQIYGFPRGDTYYGTNKFSPSLEVPFWVVSNDPRLRTGPLGSTFFPTIPSPAGEGVPVKGEEANFTENARLSRFGVLFTGQRAKWLCDAELEGCIEMDFYDTIDNVIASRSVPRIRLGYVKTTWDGFSIMVGQYWDIISPLYPSINDDVLMWNAGNLGDRRPQVRLTYDADLGYDRHLIVTAGATANDTVQRRDLDENGYFDGEAAGFPGVQGRVAFRTATEWCNQNAEVGVWGHFSERRTDVRLGLSKRDIFESYSVGGDWEIPVCECVKLRGEAFYGQLLDDYRGGIDQSLNPVLGKEIRSWGGWTEVVVKPVEWYQLALGTTLDHPLRGDLFDMKFSQLPRTRNWTYYVGNRFPFGGGLTVGVDFEFWHTDYLYLSEGQADRFKFWAMLAF